MNFTDKYNHIIFVDESDTNLGPFAAALLGKKLKERRIYSFSVSSRGNVVLFPEPVNPKITEIAASCGLDLGAHKARPLLDEDFSADTLILAIDGESDRQVHENHRDVANVFALRQYVGENGDVVTPIGGDIDKYRAACELTERLLDLLIEVRILADGGEAQQKEVIK